MSRSNEITAIEKPSGGNRTRLRRRGFMGMLKAGGGLVLGASLAGCSGGGGGGGGGGGSGSQSNGSQGNGSQGNNTQKSRKALDEFVIARSSDADNLDPDGTSLSSSSQVMSLLYDGLILEDGNQNFHQALGKGFDVNGDGTEWVIECNVDKGIKFHNGKKLTVDDVVFTFKRVLEKSLLKSFAIGSLNGVEKVDKKRVKFTFDEPFAFFDSNIALNSYFGIIPENLGGKTEEEFGRSPIGTGPYQLEEWVQGEKIVLTRNENWKTPTYGVIKSKNPPVPQKIVWQVIPSTTPRIQSLLSGDVDAVTGVTPDKRQQIKSSNETTLHTAIGGTLNYLAPHNGLPPTDDLNVRKAIAHGVDRERIVSDIYKGAGKVNYAPMAAGYPSWAGPMVKKKVGYEYDPKKAKQLLEKAGWKQGGGNYRKKGDKTLSVSMVSANAPSTFLQTSEEVAAMLGDIGINVNITTTKPNTAITTMLKGNTNLTYSAIGWSNATIVQGMLSSGAVGATNLQFFKDKKVDQYLTEAIRTLNDKKREKIYRKMQLRVTKLCGTIPIMTPNAETAVRSEFTGYHHLDGAAQNIWLDIAK